MDSKCHVRRLAFTLTTGVILLAAGAVLAGENAAYAQPSQSPTTGTPTTGTPTTGTPTTGTPTTGTPTTGTSATAYCQDFIAHLSQAVGVGQVRLQSAMTRAARETVNDALAKRDINNQQAGTINAQLSKGSICTAHRNMNGLHGMGGGTHANAYCQDFVGHLSQSVGVGEPKVQSALVTAARETISDGVARGDITSKQASTIEGQLSSGSICNVRFAAGVKHGMSQSLTTAIATALGTSPEHVRSQLDQGKSVSAIAPAGMTEQQFATALQNAIKTQLDAKVQAGTLSQSQENQLLQRVPALASRLWTQGEKVPSPEATGTTASPHATGTTASPHATGTASPHATGTASPHATGTASP
jgi:hypothetical protein